MDNMEKPNIAVLFGGCSTEYEISLQSASAVIEQIDPLLFSPVLVGISRDGEWYRYTGPLAHIAQDRWHRPEYCVRVELSASRGVHGLVEYRSGSIHTLRLDAAFPVLHGKNGEDGTVQGLLELAGIPVVGCDSLCSGLCMAKHLAHTIVSAQGVEVPRGFILRQGECLDDLSLRAGALGYPLFVKPEKSGSSFGVSRVLEEIDLLPAVLEAFRYDSLVLVEEAVPGFEVGCAILGQGESLFLGAIDEIELHEAPLFDYVEKYTLKTSEIHMPARIDSDTAARIKHTAALVYRALGCAVYARVDLFLTPDGRVVFHEVNTIPGFTSHSRYPNMMRGAGLDFPALVNRLIGEVLV